MSDDGQLVADVLDDGLPDQEFTRDRTASYWCRKCGSYLFSAPNAWTQISSRAVLHKGSAYRTGDVAMNLKLGEDEFDGNGKLKGCSLRLLLCKHRPGAAGPDCENKVAIKCVRATRQKRYKDWVFFMYPQIAIRRGKQSEDEPFIIDGVPATVRSASKSSVPARRTAMSSTQALSPSTASANFAPLGSLAAPKLGMVGSGSLDETDTPTPGSPNGQLDGSPAQTIPIRAGTSAKLTHQDESHSTDSRRTGQTVKHSSTRAADGAHKLTPAGRASLATDLRDLGIDYDYDEDEEDDDGPMIQVRDQNQGRNDVELRLDNQNIQLQRQGLLLDKQNTMISKQGDIIEKLNTTVQKHEGTIQALVARIDSLESKLRLQDRQATEQMLSLKRQVESAEKARLEKPAPKRRLDHMNGLEPYVSDPVAVPSHDQPTPKVPPSNKDDWDDSQEIKTYLRKTVREDDSEDEDYDPDQDTIVVQSASTTHRPGDIVRDGPTSNRLHTAARPLERSPQSKKPSFQQRAAFQTLQGTSPYASANESSTPQNTGHGHSGNLIRRGVSGGRTKAVPPQLSHANLAAGRADSEMTPTWIPKHFDSNKRQRLESGSGSFKNSTTPSMSGGGGSGSKGMRDAEGYLLKANGQRDLRSIRGRTLGNAAFRPSNGYRRTVASLEAEGYLSGSAGGSPPASTERPKTQAPSQSVSFTSTAPTAGGAAFTSLRSPPLGVTTIANHLAAMENSFHVGQEAEKMQQERINAALSKDSGKQYSSRHAEFMSRLGIVD